MTPSRIFFHKTRKNSNSLAALVGALEFTCSTHSGEIPAELPDLSDWDIGFFGPAAKTDGPGTESQGTTVVAYSFMSVDRPEVDSSLERVREQRPDAILIAGGAHPSGDPEGTLAMGFDRVFVGEGELSLPWFLHGLSDGLSGPAIIRGGHPPVDLDRFPSFAAQHNLLAPIELSRGCPFACKFCHIPFIQGRRMRHRSVESVLDHVRLSRERGRVRTWFVSSDAFAYGSADGRQGDRNSCERLLKGCRDEGMREVFFGGFPSEVRPDHVTEELLELVVNYCSNRTVVVGAQSGSDRVLRSISRGHSVSQALDAVRKVHSFGLIPHVDFMVGLPGETLEERRQTLETIEVVTEQFGGRVHVHYFMPHPGTPYGNAVPEPVEDEILGRLEVLTGKNVADGFWRRQRHVAARANPDVLKDSTIRLFETDERSKDGSS